MINDLYSNRTYIRLSSAIGSRREYFYLRRALETALVTDGVAPARKRRSSVPFAVQKEPEGTEGFEALIPGVVGRERYLLTSQVSLPVYSGRVPWILVRLRRLAIRRLAD